jgi:kallikrein
VLKKIDVPIVPFAKCQDELRRTRLGRRFILHESFVCAGGKDQDACKGEGKRNLFLHVKFEENFSLPR